MTINHLLFLEKHAWPYFKVCDKWVLLTFFLKHLMLQFNLAVMFLCKEQKVMLLKLRMTPQCNESKEIKNKVLLVVNLVLIFQYLFNLLLRSSESIPNIYVSIKSTCLQQLFPLNLPFIKYKNTSH